MAVGVTRKGIVTFGIGLLLGFAVTYMLTFTMRYRSTSNNLIYSSGFIPKSPHSHGEMDQFRGPDESVHWSDEHSHLHAEESSDVAIELAKRVRVLCWVMTNPSNHQAKAKHIKVTWGKRCNILIFMSSEADPQLPAVRLEVSEGRDNLWAKTKEAFKYVHKHHLNDADWFFKADDDTYTIVENMRYFLSDKDPNSPVYYGRRFKPYVSQGYMSGGAGYVLSREALVRFITKAASNSDKCRADSGGAEDLEMGKCLQNIGVKAGDSRDELGRERFHPFIPEHHLIPGILPSDMWYFNYNFYPAKQGPECCSDYAITFHYVPPNLMYVLDYMIYHLKPYGIQVKQQCPADTNKQVAEHKHTEKEADSSELLLDSNTIVKPKSADIKVNTQAPGS
ncbi:glycoprotein-N-acetylgalactosamine 3-beta-galactosyltransferase 1-like [Gigantopelta aegis]|uniref:glycoprotein-N-acetylgalactosamine 3-beta-galactosyltransferase 1-like n=1 Tax=Gigantopelta aegis TaxID=1735272 RepID=UPI001B88BFC8|nr:glycoprotein-N-acetylgalactosamine 3-beta-galactosyltransferase 1-like [Gigantopelta aegis]